MSPTSESMTPGTVFFNSWNDGLPVEIFLNHLHHSLRLGSRECNGKYRLLSKAWKALVDANVAVLSCMEFFRDCDGCEHYLPNFPALQVVRTSLLVTMSPLNLREIDIPTTEVSEGLLEAVLSKTSLDQLTLSGYGPSVNSTNPVLAKFSQLVHLESITLVGTIPIDNKGLAFMSVSWWFKGRTLAAALRGIPELTTATLYKAGTAAQNGHQVATSFITTLPSSSLKHLRIYSDENVLFTNAFLALSSFHCLISLTVIWDDGMMHRFPGGARWSRDLLVQLQPLRNLREVTVTKLRGIGKLVAARYLPNVRDWGSTKFASPDDE